MRKERVDNMPHVLRVHGYGLAVGVVGAIESWKLAGSFGEGYGEGELAGVEDPNQVT